MTHNEELLDFSDITGSWYILMGDNMVRCKNGGYGSHKDHLRCAPVLMTYFTAM